MLRQRVLFVPFNLHHPVMVDDPDFDLDSHIYRAALPAPGGMRELHDMISQIMCHRLDRYRPLWELWMLTGLENGRVAIVHKIHHCLADGAATVRYLSRVFEQQASLQTPRRCAHTLAARNPCPARGDWCGMRCATTSTSISGSFPRFSPSCGRQVRGCSPSTVRWAPRSLERLAHPPPRTRLNHALSARRSFTTRQIPLQEAKAVARALGGTINDLVLALSATAIRDYLLFHHDLPDEPLCTAIPVSADEPGSAREVG